MTRFTNSLVTLVVAGTLLCGAARPADACNSGSYCPASIPQQRLIYSPTPVRISNVQFVNKHDHYGRAYRIKRESHYAIPAHSNHRHRSH